LKPETDLFPDPCFGKFIEGYCQQNGIVPVLEGNAAGQAGILIWANHAIDIASDLMAQYNMANPPPAASSPAPK